MITVRPRRMMSVERMRHQRQKHFDTRYRIWYMSQEVFELIDMSNWSVMLEHVAEEFRIDVRRWNMWRKAPLSDIRVEMQTDLDYNRQKIIFDVRRLKQISTN